MCYVFAFHEKVILIKLSSLVALKVVIMITFSADSDENFVKITTFSFRWFFSDATVYETTTLWSPPQSQSEPSATDLGPLDCLPLPVWNDFVISSPARHHQAVITVTCNSDFLFSDGTNTVLTTCVNDTWVPMVGACYGKFWLWCCGFGNIIYCAGSGVASDVTWHLKASITALYWRGVHSTKGQSCEGGAVRLSEGLDGWCSFRVWAFLGRSLRLCFSIHIFFT